MVIVQQIGEGVADAERDLEDVVLVRGEERDPLGLSGRVHIFRRQTIPVDRRGGEANRLGVAGELRDRLEHQTRAEAVREEGEALRASAPLVAEGGQAPAALPRDAALERVVDDGQPRITRPQHADEEV